jgi:2-polyprenyl-6-methoxyphenol hydroxylase-like FAD-dependent oxidoreductase
MEQRSSPFTAFRSDNTVEPHVLWHKRPTPADRSTPSGHEEDCQRLGPQLGGELAVELHIERRKSTFPFSRSNEQKVNGAHNRNNQSHQSNIYFPFLTSRAGDR